MLEKDNSKNFHLLKISQKEENNGRRSPMKFIYSVLLMVCTVGRALSQQVNTGFT